MTTTASAQLVRPCPPHERPHLRLGCTLREHVGEPCTHGESPARACRSDIHARIAAPDAIVNFMRAASDPDYVPPPVAADAGWEGNKGNVIHLTGDTVEDLREQHPKMFAMFYAPWCGHCKQLKPDWAKVSEQLTPIFADEIEGDDAVVMAAADCTAGGSEICGKYEVNGYPTLMYFGDSHAEPEKYEGPRTAKALKKFAVRKVDPDWKEPPVVSQNAWLSGAVLLVVLASRYAYTVLHMCSFLVFSSGRQIKPFANCCLGV